MKTSTKRLLFILPLVLFLGVVVWASIPLIRGDDPRVLPSSRVGKPAPDFELAPLPGHEAGLSRADLGGEPVLVNVFASWCVPCLAEHPLLTKLAREDGVTIYGINYKDRPRDALEWLEEHGNPYARIGTDRDGRTGIDWGVYGVPETFLIDKDGWVRYRHAGPLTPTLVEQLILPMLLDLQKEV